MKTSKNILIAFLLNLSFSVLEFIGGFLTGSISIFSDSIHDLGDSISIGISYFLEKKSHNKPTEEYTFGFRRYSIIAALFTSTVLVAGSALVIYEAIRRVIDPSLINYDRMIVFAIFGVVVNFLAAFFTREGDSANQRAVNLHMLEDVLGWVIVLLGAIVMRFTDFALLDPIMSICVALFILYEAIKNVIETLKIFLEKVPEGISIPFVKEEILEIPEIKDVHHIHVWTLDGETNFATLHVVSDEDHQKVKALVKSKMKEIGVGHTTVEIEEIGENCSDFECKSEENHHSSHHHHHHHH